MAYVVIAVVAFLVSGLTLFSGFGLGTLLMPAFALFFPIEVAVGATALVHIANNLFKLGLLHRSVDRGIVGRFGIPAILTAFAGAYLLFRISGQAPLHEWTLAGRQASITPIKLIMGFLILVFAVIDLMPSKVTFDAGSRWLPLGGVLSGFFGGLSGHQGALRAAFLLPLGLTPTAYAATSTAIGCIIDLSRLVVYAGAYAAGRSMGFDSSEGWSLVGVACLSAFGGAYIGKKLLRKVTIDQVRKLAGGLLILVALGLGSGLI